MGFTVKKVLRKVLRRVSEKAVSQKRCPERPLGEYDPLGVRPKKDKSNSKQFCQTKRFVKQSVGMISVLYSVWEDRFGK